MSNVMGFPFLSVSKPSSFQPVDSRHHSFKCFFSFFIDCVVIKALPSLLLNFRLSAEESPASVQTMNFACSKSFMICSSKGMRVCCSLLLPGWIENARGMPSPSINSPISTIGFGRCSLEGPYCFIFSSCSISKKKFVQS